MDSLFASAAGEGAAAVTTVEEPDDGGGGAGADDADALESMEPTPMVRGDVGGNEPAPNPLLMGFDAERDNGDDVALMYAPAPHKALQQALNASLMPNALFDAQHPELTLVLRDNQYHRFSANVAFVTILGSLVHCFHWPAPAHNSYVKDAVTAVLHMLRSKAWSLPLKGPAHANPLRGSCEGDLGQLCYDYVNSGNAFIICYAAEVDPVIRTWCNPQRAPFHWLFLHALCCSVQGVRADSIELNREGVIAQFEALGQKTPENVAKIMSLFNELD
jgi:hypothetical protein